MQKITSLSIFTIFTFVVFCYESLRLNHIIGFVFLVLVVSFILKSEN
ncbi:hypothetical protein [Campylobacter majalis]|nr:hypothetical protein [Campylobacter majalis]